MRNLGLGRKLAVRGLTLLVVLFSVLLLTVVIIGATGVSDKILSAILSDRVRIERQRITQANPNISPEELDATLVIVRDTFRKSLGLDQPWYVRLPAMVYRIAVLDLGTSRTVSSFAGSTRISDIILERMPNTIMLMVTVLIINFVLSLALGVKIATKPGSILDKVVSTYSAISYALPSWWLAMLLILGFAFYVRLFPFGGMYSAPPPTEPLLRSLDVAWHLCLPVASLVIALSGSWIYITRSIVITTAQEDYVTAARAKGLPERLVLWRYIIRASAPPILTNLILGLAFYLSGAILTETVFLWPGMGRLYYLAIVSVDEALILATTYVFTLVYVIARFILEILYVIVDPRVRYE